MPRWRLAVPFACSILAACGREATIPEYTSPTAAFDAAMLAVSKADLTGLWPILTPRGKDKVELDLRAWQLRLRDPHDAALISADVLRLRPDAKREDFDKARDGAIADVWRFFLMAKPRPAKPKSTGLRVDPHTKTAQQGYLDVHGTERVVTLKQENGRWRVDDLPL